MMKRPENKPQMEDYDDPDEYLNDLGDYIFQFEAYAVDLEKYRDDPEQDQRNKDILENRIYVQTLDENTVVVGFPQPLKCSIDISDASKYKIYFITSRLKELFSALCEYYDYKRP